MCASAIVFRAISASACCTGQGRCRISLFDPSLSVVKEFTVSPGRRALLVDLDSMPAGHEGVIAAACRVRDYVTSGQSISFRADGIEQSPAVVCVAIPKAPQSVDLDGKPLEAPNYDYAEGILRLRFTNTAKGVSVVIHR